MTGLCGWFTTDGSRPAGDIRDRAHTVPAPEWSSVDHLSGPAGACLVRGGWIARDDEGRIAALAGHPQWQEAQLAALARDRDPAHALLEAYRRHGDALFQHLGGDFVLAVIDPLAMRVLAGIDRMGQHSLHFAPLSGGVVFGSSAVSVLSHPGMERSLTPSGIHHYLFFHMVPAPVSLFAGLGKLQMAQRLRHDGRSLNVETYWLPRFEEPHDTDPMASGRELHRLLDDSVRRLANTEGIGAFLSGGLDSSTVSGLLAGLLPGKADTFSIGFDAPGYDEMAYARITSRHFDTRGHEYYVTPDDVVEAVSVIAAGYDEPFGNSSALPAWFCARLAADNGVTRLLAGDGGDELFAGNARYAKQGVFEHWQRLPAPVRTGLLEPFFTRLPRGVPLLGKARSYVEQARIPLPDRMQTYNHLHRLPIEEMFEPGFLAQVDREAPWRLIREIYARPDAGSALNRMMYLDWQHTLADNDLRKVSRVCQLAGVDVAFPMLDDALVAFSCRVPSALKLRKGRLRHFYKEAMSGFLPAEIIDKKKHGFGLPFGVWMHDHAPLRELAYDALLRFKDRDILKPSFIDRLITLHRDGHAAYYGELVWVIMMLELWLDTHAVGAKHSPGPRAMQDA